MADLPPLRALQVFEVVGRCGGMTKAAHELGVSPGAVSQHIKSLEDALSLKLIVRKAGGLALTELGERYHRDVSACFQGLRKAHHGIMRTRASALIISALPLLAGRWLAPSILEWQQHYPDISVHLEGSLVEPHVDDHAFDFRVTYADRARHFDRSVTLFTDSLVPVCSPKLLAGRPPLESPADLLAFRLVGIDWSPHVSPPPSWQGWFRQAGIASGVIADTVVFSHSSLAIEAAIDGHGVTLAQSALIADDLRAGRLVTPFARTLELPSPYVLAWNNAVFEKNGAREVHRWIIGLARRHGGHG